MSIKAASGALLASVSLLVPRAGAATCNGATLEQFEAQAQALDAAATPLGTQLLQCPWLRDAAVQWQAFLLDQTGRKAAARALDLPVPRRTAARPLDPLSKARGGDYAELLRRIDDQEARYAQSPEAQLTLGRVLVRKGLFRRGREAYLVFLRLRPDDDEALTEYLYSFIWEGDLAGAQAQLDAAGRSGGGPGFVAAVQRGKALVARLRGQPPAALAQPAQSKPESPLRPGTYAASAGLFLLDDVYDRRTVDATYDGRFTFRLAGHEIRERSLDRGTVHATELAVGTTLRNPRGFGVAATAGYFSKTTHGLIGDAALYGESKSGLYADVGAGRRPLVLSVPLPDDALGLERDTLFVDLRWRRLVELRSELSKEDAYAAHQKESALGRIPLLREEAPGDAFYARVPVVYELHPRPNPNYPSDPKSLTLGLGLEGLRAFSGAAGAWSLGAAADYELAFVTDRANTPTTSQSGLVAAAVDVSWIPPGTPLRLTFTGRYVRAEDQRLLLTQERLSGVLVGLGYSTGETTPSLVGPTPP